MPEGVFASNNKLGSWGWGLGSVRGDWVEGGGSVYKLEINTCQRSLLCRDVLALCVCSLVSGIDVFVCS